MQPKITKCPQTLIKGKKMGENSHETGSPSHATYKYQYLGM
jgi:hypothetical protein